ncbi:MAG: hypothetical protein ACRDI3_07090, partial [Actinomycetota bacterium]
PEPRSATSLQALEMARRLGDPDAIAYALKGRFEALLAPENLAERGRLANELLSLSEKSHDEEGVLQGHVYLFHCALESGDMERASDELSLQTGLADRLRQPNYVWEAASHAALMALLQGNFQHAEELIQDAFEKGRDVESWYALLTYRLQLYLLRWEQGRLHELEKAIEGDFQRYESAAGWHAIKVHFYKETGQSSRARHEFDYLAENKFASISRNEKWLPQLSLLCEVASYLEDAERATTLYEILLPYSDLNAYATSDISIGSVARGLGILATTMRRFDDAARHFDRALEMNFRLRASPWIARTQRDYGQMLRARDAHGDREIAAKHFGDALAITRRLGMVALEAELKSMVDPAFGEQPTPVTVGSEGLFRLEGEYWTIAYEGTTCRLKDSKGLRHLATLLSDPGREFHSLDLARTGNILPASSVRLPTATPGVQISSGTGDAGAILDPTAKAAYKRRLNEIDSELERADEWGDREQGARLQAEREFLLAEISSAVGLGGRDRKNASASERARVSVTRAIRSAIDRLHQNSPELARHLDATIRTGTFCSYQPDPRLLVTWISGPDRSDRVNR